MRYPSEENLQLMMSQSNHSSKIAVFVRMKIKIFVQKSLHFDQVVKGSGMPPC